MTDYLRLMRDGREMIRPIRSIRWSVIDIENIAVEGHQKWAGLQIADVITSGLFSGLEPNIYGNYEPSYGRILKPILLRNNLGGNLNTGLVPVPHWNRCGANAHQHAFFAHFSS
jgi:hypothetical protein